MFAQLYHAHQGGYQDDLPFWLELARQAGDPLLELGCGTGRVLTPLAEAGHRVVGLDHDQAMLKFLHRNFTGRFPAQPLILAADLSAFHLGEKFSLILLPCNTFSTLEQNERLGCLERVNWHLKLGGIFAVSLPNPQILQSLSARSAAELEDEFLHPLIGNPVQVYTSWQRSRHSVKITWRYDHLLPDGTVEPLVVVNTHQLVSLETLEAEFRNCGLNITHTYGDFDLSGYTNESPQLILLAEPAAR